MKKFLKKMHSPLSVSSRTTSAGSSVRTRTRAEACKKILKKRLLFSLFLGLFACEPLFAQTKIMVSASPKGITIFIASMPLNPQTKVAGGWIGFNIYRAKERNGEFKLLTKKPFGLPENAEKFAEILDKKTMDGFKESFKTDQNGVFQKFLEPNKDYTFLAVMNFPIGRALGLVYDDTDVKEKQTYYYKVAKVRQDGSEGEMSEVGQATEGKPTIPMNSPTKIKTTQLKHGLLLEFSKADDNTFRYVYRSQDSLATYVQLNKTKMGRDEAGQFDSYTDTTAKPGNKYYYTIASADLFDNRVFSDTISVKLKGNYNLASPQFMSVTVHKAGVELTWLAKSGLDSIAGFDVLRRTITEGEGEAFVKINPNLIPANKPDFIDQTAVSGSKYEYVIRTVAKDLMSFFPSVQYPFFYNNLFSPLPPQTVKAEPLRNAIKISWEASPDKDVMGYMVFRAYKTEKTPETISELLPKTSLSFTDSSKSLTKNITFAYYVKAYTKAEYESPFTKPVFASPLAELHKPERMNALSGIYTEFKGNQLKWSLPMDRETQSVRLFRAEASDTTKWEQIYTEKVIEGKFVFNDTIRNPLKTYAYRICAVSYDNIQSDFSEQKRLEPKILDVQAPQGLTIQQKGASLKVSWFPVLDENLKSYVVYRRTYSTKSQKIAEVPKGTHFFEDKATKNETYYYVIKAVNVLDKEGKATKEIAYEVEL